MREWRTAALLLWPFALWLCLTGCANEEPCVEVELSDQFEPCNTETDNACDFEAVCAANSEVVTVDCNCILATSGEQPNGRWRCAARSGCNAGEGNLVPLNRCVEGIDLDDDGNACDDDATQGCKFDAVCVPSGEVVTSFCACNSELTWRCRATRCQSGNGELARVE